MGWPDGGSRRSDGTRGGPPAKAPAAAAARGTGPRPAHQAGSAAAVGQTADVQNPSAALC
ncbi:hypothetical protein OH687_05950 [Burkholderia anthina]|nr:hypothetical protein OH687_05950 [Burkholderia anthina]